MSRPLRLALLIVLIVVAPVPILAWSQEKPKLPDPTHADVQYGPHERNVLDFYQAKSDGGPTPLLIVIHGGGFVAGDKRMHGRNLIADQLDELGIENVYIHTAGLPKERNLTQEFLDFAKRQFAKVK